MATRSQQLDWQEIHLSEDEASAQGTHAVRFLVQQVEKAQNNSLLRPMLNNLMRAHGLQLLNYEPPTQDPTFQEVSNEGNAREERGAHFQDDASSGRSRSPSRTIRRPLEREDNSLRLGIQTEEMGTALEASGAFKSQHVPVIPLIGKLRVHAQGYVDQEELCISPLATEDVILGAPWFHRLAAVLEYLTRTIFFKFRNRDISIHTEDRGRTKLNFSSAYHPQTNDQSEIANSIVLDLLKSYVGEATQANQWETYLPHVEYAYNNTIHTSTGKNPFEVIEERPRLLLILKPHEKIFAADEEVRDIRVAFDKIKESIQSAQQTYKRTADKHRKPLQFKEGDWVLLRFTKARLNMTIGKNWKGEQTGHQKYYMKLAKRYYGPFQILSRINETAYRLKLPANWHIHNAFHVSLLKPFKGDPPKDLVHEEPPLFDDIEEILQPEEILRHEENTLRSGASVHMDLFPEIGLSFHGSI
ncbi:hypothetical protein L7F22_058998 [Adiantum nelumboides]|nr:hypothetical protein [Adiantum nelumboides]